MPVAEPDIALHGVSKTFGQTVALDDLHLEIPRGAFFALLGPSGCGKTTTLRIIGGFEDPTTGTVHLGGQDVTDQPPYRRDVNTVFQSYALFPHLDVQANVAFGLQRRRLPREEIRRRVAETLELTQLSPLAGRRPAQLSGGQQQRVALARALVNRPRALLLDEPLGALDLRLRKQLQLELKRIHQDIGITFVHVTHDQEEAMTMADEIVVMNEGHIEQRGTAEELYERPATPFVANFLGVSNLIDGTVDGRDSRFTSIRTAAGEVLRVPADRLAAGSGAARIGVRPEKIRILPGTATVPELDNSLRGTVVLASYLGVALHYQVRTRTGDELTVVVQNVGDAATVSPGQEVLLTWGADHTFAVIREEGG
jgi:spermidine/putrescine transport system ATP-binding protein